MDKLNSSKAKSYSTFPSASTEVLTSRSQLESTSEIAAFSPGLKKEVGIYGGLSLIVGAIIGSGIFASASVVAVKSGSVGMMLVVWIGGGVLAMLASLCYIELGLLIKTSGAEYPYLFKAFGPLTAFLFSWSSNILLKPASMSVICLTFGNYVVEPFFSSENCGSIEARKNFLAKLLAALAIGECSEIFTKKVLLSELLSVLISVLLSELSGLTHLNLFTLTLWKNKKQRILLFFNENKNLCMSHHLKCKKMQFKPF